ncbi:uncharacterized protein HD556DRAFT_199029 [Suillus plorans]|uniref:Uncharacterized protein n=1 Tax=Suillus plorans TaxID=116603 RepID=A0A9P7DMV3_9AGAM|nr:uncharacterized protein HD556DRAFT_199029 [Suillus plorans]KAG1798663.1 hypothetical protein HD556DRAFT_199029 [Suillus plorans]
MHYISYLISRILLIPCSSPSHSHSNPCPRCPNHHIPGGNLQPSIRFIHHHSSTRMVMGLAISQASSPNLTISKILVWTLYGLARSIVAHWLIWAMTSRIMRISIRAMARLKTGTAFSRVHTNGE